MAELELLWLGLFLGVAAMALAYATGEALMRGDAVNGWYALHIVMMVFYQLVQLGYADRLFAEQDAAMARAANLVAGTLLAAVSVLFARRVLPRALGNLRADRWALAVAAFGVALTAG
jgi:hypothetical protein